MAIYIVDGKPRHGKTAWLMSHIPAWLKDAKNNDYKIYSNVFININTLSIIRKNFKKPEDCIGDVYKKKDLDNPKKWIFYWRDIDAWNLMKRGRIIADEGTRYFNSRQWSRLSPDTEIKLQQHGKEDLDIWTTTQHYTRLDVSLRVLAERFFRVERTIGWGNTTYFSKITEHYLEDLERWERNPEAFERGKLLPNGEEANIPKVESEVFWIRKKWKELYNTRQQVLSSKPMPLIHVARYCNDLHCRLHLKPKITHL